MPMISNTLTMKMRGTPFKILIWLLFPITVTIVFLVWKKKKNDQKIKNDKTKLSRSTTELKIIADLQETYMGDPGTKEKAIFKSLEELNENDLKEVFNQFGYRDYFFGVTMNADFVLMGENINLLQWYTKELSTEDLNKMRKIWEKTGLIF